MMTPIRATRITTPTTATINILAGMDPFIEKKTLQVSLKNKKLCFRGGRGENQVRRKPPP